VRFETDRHSAWRGPGDRQTCALSSGLQQLYASMRIQCTLLSDEFT
jgi:hypothetical protein